MKVSSILYTICLLLLIARPLYAQSSNTQGANTPTTTQPANPNPTTTQPITPQNSPVQSPVQQTQPSTVPKPWYEVVALFLWPSIALFALLLFRAQLTELLSALARNMQKARVKMLGVEFEVAHIQSTDQFKNYSKNIGEKPVISGDPDKFQLLFKASNARLAKSTKVMNLSNGCLVQVSTREVMEDNSIAVAEALAFVPNLNVKLDKTYEDRKPEKQEKVTADFVPAPDVSQLDVSQLDES